MEELDTSVGRGDHALEFDLEAAHRAAHMSVREEPDVLTKLCAAAQHKSISGPDRIRALAMACHPRLGAESPARRLTKDVLRVIHFHMSEQQSLLLCGGHARTGGPPQQLQDLFELDLQNGLWRRLCDMPRALSGHCCAHRPEQQELWVFGGIANKDCFIYSALTDSWAVIDNICDDDFFREGAACVIHGNRAFIVGGYETARRLVAAETDVLFDLTTGYFYDVPARPYASRCCRAAAAVLVGSLVVVALNAPRCVNLREGEQVILLPFDH